MLQTLGTDTIYNGRSLQYHCSRVKINQNLSETKFSCVQTPVENKNLLCLDAV